PESTKKQDEIRYFSTGEPWIWVHGPGNSQQAWGFRLVRSFQDADDDRSTRRCTDESRPMSDLISRTRHLTRPRSRGREAEGFAQRHIEKSWKWRH
ncbi:unnamed protein product, partial [Musa acuminata subsp. burmannicoides]